jgi:hypothetical protein
VVNYIFSDRFNTDSFGPNKSPLLKYSKNEIYEILFLSNNLGFFFCHNI